jgi:signal transduction histidine kinase
MAPGIAATKAAIDTAEALDRIQAHWLEHLIHDLSSPLFAARGYLRMALDQRCGSLTPIQRRYLAGALENVDKLADLTRGIRDFPTRADGLELAPVDIQDLIQQTASDLNAALTEKNVLLVYDTPEESLWTIGDAGKIEVALGSFLSAAITFASCNGVVRIVARQEDDTILVEFSTPCATDVPGGPFSPDLSESCKLWRRLGGDTKLAYSAESGSVIRCEFPVVGSV